MPRNGAGVYSHPFPNVVAGTTIESAVFNGNTSDVEQDLNTPRPIVAGGTGANNAHDALIALNGEEAHQTVTNYDTFPFVSGSFQSEGTATSSPVAGHGFHGVAIVNSAHPDYILIEARDIGVGDANVPTLKYIRQKIAGVWGPWTREDATLINAKVSKSGDTMTGSLVISKAGPNIMLDTTVAVAPADIYFTRNSVLRWALRMDASPESSGNAGSNFVLYRANDAGAVLNAAITIERSTGNMTLDGTDLRVQRIAAAEGLIAFGNGTKAIYMNGTDFIFVNAGGVQVPVTPTSGSHATSKAYVDARVAKAGDTMTGSLGVGATAGSSPGYFNSTVGADIGSIGYGSFCRAAGPALVSSVNADGDNVNFFRSGTRVGTITVNTTTTAYNTSSDIRLKEDLKSFDAGRIVDDTEVYNFAWKATGARSYGVSAQQANEVYPQAVFHDTKYDSWFIDYSKYVPVLLQELKALRARVAELEGKVGIGTNPA